MKKEELYKIIGDIDKKYIEEADCMKQSKKKHVWIRWSVATLCMCLIISMIKMDVFHKDRQDVLIWSDTFKASDYFKNNSKQKLQNEDSSSDVMPPYAIDVSINNKRTILENSNVLPTMSNHHEHSFNVYYNGDGSLYKVSFLWMKRNENNIDEYSDLKLIVSPDELNEFSDVIKVEVDDKGNVISENVTVTKRDDILIYASGKENTEKKIFWQKQNNWYQIEGSFNDSYDDMVMLLEWFWKHPLNLKQFEKTNDIIIYSNMDNYPQAFHQQIPDFRALGYTAIKEDVNLYIHDGNYLPVYFEGIYTKGTIKVQWIINSGADANAWSLCLGRVNEISQEEINEALSHKQIINIYFDLPCMASLKIENGTGDEIWKIIQTLNK